MVPFLVQTYFQPNSFFRSRAFFKRSLFLGVNDSLMKTSTFLSLLDLKPRSFLLNGTYVCFFLLLIKFTFIFLEANLQMISASSFELIRWHASMSGSSTEMPNALPTFRTRSKVSSSFSLGIPPISIVSRRPYCSRSL